ncbi:AI-2E family transporter [Desemzia sp. RIT 804]|uniref:AI-2E family transporter n=1 Tax=Desemzia sp. RIT 804 TaxID=2810209 RepID=UPI001BB3F596|nr:AI-2E family transporter [Desemzia sp. RIT 804]
MKKEPGAENNKVTVNWFKRWFLSNKVVAILLVLLLILINIYVFSKVSYVLNPVKDFLEIVGLPVILSVILYYLLNPVIDWMEAKKIPRIYGITIVFLIILGLLIWGVTTLIPLIQNQLSSLVTNWPAYWNDISRQIDGLIRSEAFSQIQTQFQEFNENVMNTLSAQVNVLLDSTFSGIGSVVGTITSIVVAIFTMPFILFYLLKDGKKLPVYLLKFVPTKIRAKTYRVMTEMNLQISQYVRGQLLVALCVSIMFWAGFAIIGLEFAATLGIIAGFLNIIPYLGSFVATVPAIVVALVDSPSMLLKVLIVFAIEQIIEGRVISPQILGSNLKMHPITIIFVLLTGGKLFGVVGVLFGIPGYAILKIIVAHIFQWYHSYSSLYENEENYRPADVIRRETIQNKEFK